MKKGVFEKFAKFTGKYLWFAKFSGTPFLQNTSATATLLKWGTANSGWKTLDEYSLSRNTNLKSTVQVYHFFLGSINCSVCFHSFIIFTVATRVEVFCIKSVGKHFANFIGKHLCWSLF